MWCPGVCLFSRRRLARCTIAALVGDLGALELPTGQSTLKFFRVPTEFSLSITTTSTATGEHALPSRSRPAGRPNHLYWSAALLGQQVIWAAAAEGLSPPENSLCSPSFGIRQNSGEARDKQENKRISPLFTNSENWGLKIEISKWILEPSGCEHCDKDKCFNNEDQLVLKRVRKIGAFDIKNSAQKIFARSLFNNKPVIFG